MNKTDLQSFTDIQATIDAASPTHVQLRVFEKMSDSISPKIAVNEIRSPKGKK